MDKTVFARHGSVLRLPPGFRFHPTDEELVVQYLKRKIHSCPLPALIIPDIINLRNYDPWDLPGGCKEVMYFFTRRDAKILGHGQLNRGARSGYWKAEGKEKQVVASWHNQVVGMKKVLVFYRGKPQTRTDWIMHEYRHVPQRNHSTHNSSGSKGDWVLCRIFRRKRTAKMENDNEQGRIRPSFSSSMDSSCVTELSDGSSDGEEAISART
ncbi:NAC domain-containing protein 83-like isoform X1 [Zingiber officinale]|uniref:NAC domain-containing protein 83-like isoform X1 n=1 Tax=Zingiber officinale TaxID=94328 RepID=UPI001C4AE347|nr:NAC domain-containing protein 83-like isoform X1 [Zingiber officinale]